VSLARSFDLAYKVGLTSTRRVLLPTVEAAVRAFREITKAPRRRPGRGGPAAKRTVTIPEGSPDPMH
jgi:hypothetical protein